MARAAQKNSQEININLIPREEISGQLGSTITWILTTGRYLIITAEIIALAAFLLSLKLNIDKNNLASNIKTNQGILDSKAAFEKEFDSVQTKIDDIKSLRAAHFSDNQVLTEFTKLLPQGTTLTTLEIDGTNLTFSGKFPTATQLVTLINSFNKSDKIVGLEISKLSSPAAKNPNFSFDAKALINQAAFTENTASNTQGAGQ